MGRRGPPKGEGGAPRKEINIDVARRAASIGCTADEIAALLGVARATFYLNLEQARARHAQRSASSPGARRPLTAPARSLPGRPRSCRRTARCR